MKGRGVLDQLPEFRGQEVNRGLLANDVAEHKKPDRGGKVGVFGGDFGNVAAHFVDGEVWRCAIAHNRFHVAASRRKLVGRLPIRT